MGFSGKYVLCDRHITFKRAFKYLDDKRYLVLQLYDGGVADEITQDELYELATTHDFYDEVFDEGHLSRNERENSWLETLPEIAALTQSTPNDTASSTAPESEEKS